MSRINQNDFIQKLMEKGYTESRAKKIYKDVLAVMEEALLNKQSLLLTGIGVVSPVYTPVITKNLFGKMEKCGDSLSITIKTSRAFSTKFKEEYSDRGSLDQKVGQVGGLFRK